MSPAGESRARPAPRAGRLFGIDLDDISFLPTGMIDLVSGAVVDEPIEVPAATAQTLLRSIVHLVADYPADAPPDVVWTLDRSELLVDTGSVAVTCSSGLVRLGLDVDCDQLDGPATVVVPIGVGTADRPRGLVMSTFARPLGPRAIVDTWADPLIAFAWECLLELARKLCAEVGKDDRGRALIPVEIGAAPKFLLVRAMARHDVSARTLG